MSTIQGKYIEILCFRHFARHMSFSQNDRKALKKAILDGVNVSVVLDMECGNTPKKRTIKFMELICILRGKSYKLCGTERTFY